MIIDVQNKNNKKCEQIELKMNDLVTKNDFAKFRESNKEQFIEENKIIDTLATRYELKQLQDRIFIVLEDYSKRSACNTHFDMLNQKNLQMQVQTDDIKKSTESLKDDLKMAWS